MIKYELIRTLWASRTNKYQCQNVWLGGKGSIWRKEGQKNERLHEGGFAPKRNMCFSTVSWLDVAYMIQIRQSCCLHDTNQEVKHTSNDLLFPHSELKRFVPNFISGAAIEWYLACRMSSWAWGRCFVIRNGNGNREKKSCFIPVWYFWLSGTRKRCKCRKPVHFSPSPGAVATQMARKCGTLCFQS